MREILLKRRGVRGLYRDKENGSTATSSKQSLDLLGGVLPIPRSTKSVPFTKPVSSSKSGSTPYIISVATSCQTTRNEHNEKRTHTWHLNSESHPISRCASQSSEKHEQASNTARSVQSAAQNLFTFGALTVRQQMRIKRRNPTSSDSSQSLLPSCYSRNGSFTKHSKLEELKSKYQSENTIYEKGGGRGKPKTGRSSAQKGVSIDRRTSVIEEPAEIEEEEDEERVEIKKPKSSKKSKSLENINKRNAVDKSRLSAHEKMIIEMQDGGEQGTFRDSKR